jgi:hypothetical protein
MGIFKAYAVVYSSMRLFVFCCFSAAVFSFSWRDTHYYLNVGADSIHSEPEFLWHKDEHGLRLIEFLMIRLLAKPWNRHGEEA